MKIHVQTVVCVLLVVGVVHSTEVCPDQLDGSCPQSTGSLYKQPVSADAVVSYEQLKQMLASGKLQLFDVREPDEFEEGYIPGATNIPLSDVEQAFTLTPDQFQELCGVSMPEINDVDFILYCQRGRRSLTALETVWKLGYSSARHYAGGYSEWEQLEAH